MGTDQKLRDAIKDRINGYYAVLICRKCRGYLMSPDGNTDTAPIVARCDNCKSNNGRILGAE